MMMWAARCRRVVAVCLPRPAVGFARAVSTRCAARTGGSPADTKAASAPPGDGGSLQTMDLSQLMASFGGTSSAAAAADAAKPKRSVSSSSSGTGNNSRKRSKLSVSPTGQVTRVDDSAARRATDPDPEAPMAATAGSGAGGESDVVFQAYNKPKIAGAVLLKGVTRDSKRFYRKSGVERATGLEGTGWVVTLGGRRIETPGQNLIRVPTESLAQAIALEWDYQNEHISSTNMPLMNMVVMALDNISVYRQRSIERIVSMLHTDATCHRATDPYNLTKLQEKHWDPLVRWFNETAAAGIRDLGWDTSPVDLSADVQDDAEAETDVTSPAAPAEGVNAPRPGAQLFPADKLRLRHGGNVRDHFRQPPAITAWVRHILNQQSAWHLAALAAVVDVSQSTVLALNVLAQRVGVDAAFNAAHCDELFQQNAYGVVKGWYGHGIDTEHARHQLAAAATFLHLLHADDAASPTASAAVGAAPGTTATDGAYIGYLQLPAAAAARDAAAVGPNSAASTAAV